MSELEEKKEDLSPVDDVSPQLLEMDNSSSSSPKPSAPVLVAVNANSPINTSFEGETTTTTGLSSQDGFNGNPETNPATRGATSVNKRSKRPQAKPSSALMQAKLNAQLKKRNSEDKTNSTFIIKDYLQPVFKF